MKILILFGNRRQIVTTQLQVSPRDFAILSPGIEVWTTKLAFYDTSISSLSWIAWISFMFLHRLLISH